MSVAAVIVAAGAGLRAGGELPKQYQAIGGRPMLWWTLKAFASHPGVDHVIAVIGDGHEELYRQASEGLRLKAPARGGSSRQESCRLGLEAVAPHKPDRVLIHDAARPFASQDLISHVIAWLDRSKAILPALPVADTLKFAPGGIVRKTVDRTGMWAAQTPQGFHFPDILRAHRDAHAKGANDLTDDAAVAEWAGIEVTVIPGRLENRKLTTAEDMETADRTLRRQELETLRDVRVGNGFDVHSLIAGDAVVLCGVRIPHDRALTGHSDADVAMHALTDAVLGAIGEGDIGTHFPPGDARWKGAPSRIFLERAVGLLWAKGGAIANVDITILAEAPRIGPHIAAMRAFLAPLLGVSPDRIAIKATTTETLGFIGRREGLAAMATATVRLP